MRMRDATKKWPVLGLACVTILALIVGMGDSGLEPRTARAQTYIKYHDHRIRTYGFDGCHQCAVPAVPDDFYCDVDGDEGFVPGNCEDFVGLTCWRFTRYCGGFDTNCSTGAVTPSPIGGASKDSKSYSIDDA